MSQKEPDEVAASLLKKGSDFVSNVKGKVEMMNQFKSNEIKISMSNRQFAFKLCDFEKAICRIKDAAPYGRGPSGSAVYSTDLQDDALSGYGIDAAGSFDERLACPICHCPAFDAVMTKKCGHHFHHRCLSKALQSKKQCPVCRTPMKANDFTDLKQIKESRFLYESINDVKVCCTMGCGAKVKFELLRDHVRNDCPNTVFLCKHGGCLHHASRGNIVEHERSCGEAVVLCACGESVKAKFEQEHRRLHCSLAFGKCDYCNQEGIRRSDMEKHLDVCQGAVPMSVVRGLLERMSEMEARLEEMEGADAKAKRRRTVKESFRNPPKLG